MPKKITFTISEDPKFEVISIDSDYATKLLDRNKTNRAMSSSIVASYARDMAEGRWTFTGEALKFNTAGDLLDGQQRLTAHSKTPGLVLDYLVVTGLPNDSQLRMDQGRKRTPGQQLSLLGYPSAHQLAAAVRFYLLWMRGQVFGSANQKVVTSSEIEDWMVEHGDLYDEIKSRLSIVGNVGGSVARAFLIRAYELSPEDAFEFFDSLRTLADLPENSPILALDNRLRRVTAARTRMEQRDTLGYYITAWNHWCEDRPVEKLQASKGGWSQKTFPEILPGKKK